jgi:phenylalanyl-tRNA synthetase alpha chain
MSTRSIAPPLSVLDAAALRRALSVRDCTDPAQGPHAMQLLLTSITAALRDAWHNDLHLHRASPVVSIADNYDRLHYPPDGAARDARYTRYVCNVAVLRTQTSAMIPPLLASLAAEPAAPDDVLLACPGVVYRRDCIDRLHTGEPHQLDLWRIRRDRDRRPLHDDDLLAMIATVVTAALPGRAHRVSPATHPYTEHGLQIDVCDGDAWIEIGECGLAHPAVLADAGLDPSQWSGLAMGLGLDRILMLRKSVDDIRLLRATDPRIATQMQDLSPYRPVSTMPPVRRDLSLALDEPEDAESLGDRIRELLADDASLIESVDLLSTTPHAALPEAARARLGLAPHQTNALLRVTLRALDRTLTHPECNLLRDRIYAALHRGTIWSWAARPS